MAITPDDFNSRMDEWKDWQTLPWGRLFYSVAHANLERHVNTTGGKTRPLRILDVGGGNGMDSIYYASRGHAVTLVDYSQAMLSDARQRAEAQGVAGQIEMIETDVQALDKVLKGRQFDLVLCNLMIEFVSEPQVVLQAITRRLAPGGLLSFIDGNRHNEALRAALLENDLDAALQAVGARAYPHRWFNRDVPIYAAEEMVALLERYDLMLEGQYGIWTVTPYLPNESKFDDEYYARLEQLELCLSRTEPYFRLARFFHLVMRKPVD